LTGALATAALACSSTPGITGEWLVGSRDSVDVTVEFLATGKVRMHRYYVGGDTAKREALRRDDSVAQARYAAAPTDWSVRRDSICVYGASNLGAPECGLYRIRDAGGVLALQIADEPPWPRYRARR
jgi:hypothetical protein